RRNGAVPIRSAELTSLIRCRSYRRRSFAHRKSLPSFISMIGSSPSRAARNLTEPKSLAIVGRSRGKPASGWNVNTRTDILPSVNTKQLKPWQAKKMRDALAPALGYLSRLKRRMELTGFPPDDPLYLLTVDAQRKLQHLLVELHYMSCEGGVG